MPALAPKRNIVTPPAGRLRKRRAHGKSRRGCENCKLRRVKCDEARPRCAKCVAYGVACDFSGKEGDLDVRVKGAGRFEFEGVGDLEAVTNQQWTRVAVHRMSDIQGTPRCPISINSTMTSTIGDSLRSGASELDAHLDTSQVCWEFTESHLEILARFRSRTSLTVGDKKIAPVYRDIVCRLAFQHPFLMHMLLGLTLMHDSSLSASPSHSTSLQHASLNHWSYATTLYHALLSGPIPPSYRDAIWATGVHLGAASFWYLESNDPYAVWPLKASEPGDLAWMKIGEGKRHLWRIADPTREDSVFGRVLKRKTGPCPTPPAWMESSDVSAVPEKVRLLFGMTPRSSTENNVYHIPVLILSRLQDLRLSHGNVLEFLYFTAFVTPAFMGLLESKDPKAVFLLGWWFSMCRDGTLWWVTRRARVEGEAVSIWLGRVDRELCGLLKELGRGREEELGMRGQEWRKDGSGYEVNWALDSRGRILTVV